MTLETWKEVLFLTPQPPLSFSTSSLLLHSAPHSCLLIPPFLPHVVYFSTSILSISTSKRYIKMTLVPRWTDVCWHWLQGGTAVRPRLISGILQSKQEDTETQLVWVPSDLLKCECSVLFACLVLIITVEIRNLWFLFRLLTPLF